MAQSRIWMHTSIQRGLRWARIDRQCHAMLETPTAQPPLPADLGVVVACASQMKHLAPLNPHVSDGPCPPKSTFRVSSICFDCFDLAPATSTSELHSLSACMTSAEVASTKKQVATDEEDAASPKVFLLKCLCLCSKKLKDPLAKGILFPHKPSKSLLGT